MSKDAKLAIPSQPDKDGPHQYEIEDAARTLMKAEDIKKDKKLMPHVHKHLKKQKRAIDSIAALKERRNELAMGEPDADD